ncbi:MAG: hypothetical protein OXG58_00100 [Gemmatimonadetes bacterium]|nr:hypothetical protein [Gemmatimonadota bacterium]MCY3944598.1 hypothetical protein [Gemmatimonadota bacterium]
MPDTPDAPHSFLSGTGLEVRAEESVAAGRLDVAVLLDEAAYIFELKVDERASKRNPWLTFSSPST